MTTITVVDDSKIDLELVHNVLASNGYECITLNDSTQAADAIQRIQPDFILMDIEMPHVSGIELCKQLRLNPVTRNIPIMLLSSSSDPKHIIASIHLACIDYLVKPIKADDLILTLKKHEVIAKVTEAWEPARRELERLAEKYK
jgi:CheY-like chemotaxis protein